MLKEFLRTTGTACIIAGAVLYFTMNTSDDPKLITENSGLKDEIQTLESLLDRTKEELANLQTITTNAEKTADEVEEEQEDDATSEDTVVNTVLLIEPGTTSQDVASQLEQSAIIEDAELLNAYLTAHDLSGKIQIGEYHLDSSMTIKTIAKHITTLN